MKHEFDCHHCKQHKTHVTEGFGGTGYARDKDDNKICYDCCAILDRQRMIDDGDSKALPLYITQQGSKWELSNWPGTLKFTCYSSHVGDHNWCGTRRTVWFTGPDGHLWYGVQYGNPEYNQICHCYRTKKIMRQAA